MVDKRLVCLLVTAMLLAACGETNQTRASPTLSTTFSANQAAINDVRATIHFTTDGSKLALYSDLIKAFEEANPDLKVELASTGETLGLSPGDSWPDDAWLRLTSAADVIELSPPSDAIKAGLIRDLAPFIDNDPSFQPDDFFPGMLETFQSNGATWAIPISGDFTFILYDRTLFDRADLSYPAPGWTWSDFLDIARAATRHDNGVAEWGYYVSVPAHVLLTEGQIGPLVNDRVDPPRSRLDESHVIEAVRWYTNLFLLEKVADTYYREMPHGSRIRIGDAEIVKGRVAMWADSPFALQDYDVSFEIGAVPFPVDAQHTQTTPLWVQGVVMSAGTRQPEAAWRWLAFLSRQYITNFSQTLPARRSIATTAGFWDNLDEDVASAIRYAIDHSHPSQSGHWRPIYNIFNEAVAAIIRGDQTIEEALVNAQMQAEAQILKASAEKVGATPISGFVVTPQSKLSPSGDVVRITFVAGTHGASNLEEYRTLARQFQAMHPNVRVEVRRPDFFSSPVNLSTLAQAGDCFQWYPRFEDPDNLAAVLNLEPFLDADPEFAAVVDDFYSSLHAAFTHQGQLVGLPAEVEPYVIEYNRDLFDIAGVVYPTPTWTTDDFLATAVALTQGERNSKQYGFVSDVFESDELLIILSRLGVSLFDEDMEPSAIRLNTPEVAATVRWYADLSTKYGVKPTFVTDPLQNNGVSQYVSDRETLISDSRTAMWANHGPAPGVGREQLRLGVAPLPSRLDKVAGSGFAAVSGYFISAGSRAGQACWHWITFLTGQPEAMQGLPARRSVAESNTYRQQVGAERVAAYIASLGDSTQPPDVLSLADPDSWLSIVPYWLGRAYSRVVRGEATVEAALADAQNLADRYWLCVIDRDAIARRAQWQTCAKEIDPMLPDFLFER